MLRILRKSKNWRDFQANLKPLPPKQQGDCFELLTKYYLQLDPTYKTKLKHVWLVKEVPPETRRHLNPNNSWVREFLGPLGYLSC